MIVRYRNKKTKRVVRAHDGSRLATLLAKSDAFEVTEDEAPSDVRKMNLSQLKAYADEHDIEVTATKKAEVLEQILDAEAEGDAQGGE